MYHLNVGGRAAVTYHLNVELSIKKLRDNGGPGKCDQHVGQSRRQKLRAQGPAAGSAAAGLGAAASASSEEGCPEAGRTVRQGNPVVAREVWGAGGARAGDREPREQDTLCRCSYLVLEPGSPSPGTRLRLPSPWGSAGASGAAPQHRTCPMKCTSKPRSGSAPGACPREGLVWLRTDVSSAGKPPVSRGQWLRAS